MLAEERRRRIADHVRRHGRAEVAELSALFDVSRMTVRRDLAALAADGLLARSWGGALVPEGSLSVEMPYALKRRDNEEVKRRIGRRAAALVRDGEVVILDGGTTTLHIATHLRGKRGLTVVTNDLKIGGEIALLPEITLVVTGGILQEGTFSLLGPQAEEFFSGIRANRAFMGADAVDPARGASTRTLLEVAVKRAMIAAATEAILVADHTKFARQAFAQFCRIDELAMVITDHAVPADVLAPLGDLVRVEAA